jgi:hypothetical protein
MAPLGVRLGHVVRDGPAFPAQKRPGFLVMGGIPCMRAPEHAGVDQSTALSRHSVWNAVEAVL